MAIDFSQLKDQVPIKNLYIVHHLKKKDIWQKKTYILHFLKHLFFFVVSCLSIGLLTRVFIYFSIFLTTITKSLSTCFFKIVIPYVLKYVINHFLSFFFGLKAWTRLLKQSKHLMIWRFPLSTSLPSCTQ
jgi:hypothetical protein